MDAILGLSDKLSAAKAYTDNQLDCRFKTGWKNFETLYKNLVDEWALYDNAGERPIHMDEGGKDA